MNKLQIPASWLDDPIRTFVYGAGGTGSQVIDQLASLDSCMKQLGHPGFKVTVFDPDRVSRSNIGRQRFTHADVGNYKALVLTHRINAFYGFDWGYRTEKGPTRPGGVDLVISCTDLAMFRAAFSKDNAASTTNALWLDFGNGNAEAQCVLGHLSRKVANRIPNVVDLYPELSQMQRVDAEQPSCSADEALRRQPWPINREIAMKGVGMLWSLLRDGELDYHGVQMRMKPLSLNTMPIDPETWAFYGYAPKRTRRAA
ncbi:PRTRC system ThiF family protein [Xanthomonas perforans]|uniref:THIF-type NAD/FAD binding fold domain-containing protein n=7 Tax=Xanthomonas TaxID=338 RepID=A0AAJ0N6C0_9XANT|nr:MULTISPECIES: PRTRC system ThiF family protein [Xanthomonas]MEB1846232.1 PRTRC system ThiF family protein [Xanthomonas campestris pv. campestris]APO97629.1 hypothetical protein BJD13_00055 [Xanthomonas perforans]APP78167.1 hypothetical protein BJD12_22815 [Xanthomonas vesicatoria ATCC 35937]APP82638.1 hypothetical protein BJD10_23430 [Xanthomonas hortorum pv. gardneri]APP87352.1 hypothetical protein BI317_25165 [Xanthomonas hortorum pv. gardneri]